MKYIQIDLRTLALTCFNDMILTNKEKRENKVTMYVLCELLFFSSCIVIIKLRSDIGSMTFT